MGQSHRTNILLLLLCLAAGMGMGAVAAEAFGWWFDVPSNDPRELIAAGFFYLWSGVGVGWYFVCAAAVRRMSGPADRQSQEADYDNASHDRPG